MKNKFLSIFRKMRTNWYFFIGSVRYMFDPFLVIGCICAVMLVVSIISVVVMCMQPSSDTLAYNISLAVMTGVLASGVLAVFMEMANNYRRNTVRGIVLSELFSFLVYYDSDITHLCGTFDMKKYRADFMKKFRIKRDENVETENESSEDDEDDVRSKTKSAAILKILPKAIPLMRDAYDNHSGELKHKEVLSLHGILTSYKHLISLVEGRLYLVICMVEEEDKAELEKCFTTHTFKMLMEYMDQCHENNRHEQVLLKDIAVELINEGEFALNRLGMILTDDIDENEENTVSTTIDSDDETGELDEEYDDGSGRTVSLILHQIDEEIRDLQKLATRAPGHNMVYAWYSEENKKYRKQ